MLKTQLNIASWLELEPKKNSVLLLTTSHKPTAHPYSIKMQSNLKTIVTGSALEEQLWLFVQQMAHSDEESYSMIEVLVSIIFITLMITLSSCCALHMCSESLWTGSRVGPICLSLGTMSRIPVSMAPHCMPHQSWSKLFSHLHPQHWYQATFNNRFSPAFLDHQTNTDPKHSTNCSVHAFLQTNASTGGAKHPKCTTGTHSQFPVAPNPSTNCLAHTFLPH